MTNLSQTEDLVAVEDFDYWYAEPATNPQHLKSSRLKNN